MPEGDSVAIDALRLGPTLLGRRILAARSRRHGQLPMLVGRTPQRITCHGKNLVLHLDDGHAVRVHRRMSGSWGIGGVEPRSLHGVDLAIDTGDAWVIARDMPVMEVLRPGQASRHQPLAALGPDLLGLTVGLDGPAPLREPDWAAVRSRVQAQPLRPLHELLLDQRVACGLGNVYKCELLFLHGLHPWAPVRAVAPEALDALYREGRRLLIENTQRGRRTTRGPGRTGALWVVGRAGRPCLRCGEPVQHHAGTGPSPRRTDWCPRCQPQEAPIGAAWGRLPENRR